MAYWDAEHLSRSENNAGFHVLSKMVHEPDECDTTRGLPGDPRELGSR